MVVVVVVHVDIRLCDDFAATVGAAITAYAMRTTRLVALRALVEHRSADLVLRAALVRARMRLLLLGDSHATREISGSLVELQFRQLRPAWIGLALVRVIRMLIEVHATAPA